MPPPPVDPRLVFVYKCSVNNARRMLSLYSGTRLTNRTIKIITEADVPCEPGWTRVRTPLVFNGCTRRTETVKKTDLGDGEGVMVNMRYTCTYVYMFIYIYVTRSTEYTDRCREIRREGS